MMGQSILKYANVLNQVSSKATVFHKIIIYFGISHTFVSGYIYIMLKQKVGQVRHWIFWSLIWSYWRLFKSVLKTRLLFYYNFISKIYYFMDTL